MRTVLDTESRRWNVDIPDVWGVTSSISNVISQLELGRNQLLPDIRIGPTLLLVSDYGGSHPKATHESFSFLLADLQFCWLWNDLRQEIRTRVLKDRRRMSYKGLNDRRKRLALLSFLDAANRIPGVLLTILVQRHCAQYTMRLSEPERHTIPSALRQWPIHVIRKFIWIVHLASLLVAGLSRPGQNLIWITDQDDTVANTQRVIDLTPIVAGVTSQYLPHDLGRLRFGTTACDNGDLYLEDISAIPDLAAGATAEIPVMFPGNVIPSVQVPLRGTVPSKALRILAWIGAPELQPLRKLVLVVDQGDTLGKNSVRPLDVWSD